MATLLPFRPLIVTMGNAAQVASVPYDVVSRTEAHQLAEGNELSFLRVIRSEIDLPPDLDPYSSEVYSKAKSNLLNLVAHEVFKQEDHPTLLLYELTLGEHIQIGVVGVLPLSDYLGGKIKIHEKTRPDKEADRIRHIVALEAQAEPVFVAYRKNSDIDLLVELERQYPPIIDLKTVDSIRHRVWRCKDSATLTKHFHTVPEIYIADGHHRSASACAAGEILRQANPDHRGDESYNYLLAVAFPHDQTMILPYNRVIRSADFDVPTLLAKLAQSFLIRTVPHGTCTQRGEFRLYVPGSWYALQPRESLLPSQIEAERDDINRLDIQILEQLALGPLFGIVDQRTDKNIDFIGGMRGTVELERIVNSGEAFCAFSLFPVSMQDLFAVSDSNQLMPPKSTWFEPKLRSGLFLFPFRKDLDSAQPFEVIIHE